MGMGRALGSGFAVVCVVVGLSACGAGPPADTIRCSSPPGSATDLSAEPTAWLQYFTYLRWTDGADCVVRIDVISHHDGPEHCGWQDSQYIALGNPIGTSFADATNELVYIWDPGNVIGDGGHGSVVDALPSGAIDSGYRNGSLELWIGTGYDELFIVEGERIER
jgi:hypothetical protein